MKTTKWIAAIAAGTLALLAVTGCDNGMTDAVLNAMLNNAEQDSVTAESVTLNATTLALAPGDTALLTATVRPESVSGVRWSSSDEAIATVDGGMVTARAVGKATITAKAGGMTATCEVTVDELFAFFEMTGSTLTKYTGNAAMVVIPDGVTKIEGKAFYENKSLEYVTIAGSVESIEASSDGYGAFEECTNLKSVTIEKGVKRIGNYAFYNCTSLTAVNYTGTLTDWYDITWGNASANPLNRGNAVLYIDGKSVTDVEIPDDVTEIKPFTFYGCRSLDRVTIHSSVTAIGTGAFGGCTGLTEVTYKGTLAQWCAVANDWNLVYNAQCVTMSDVENLKSMTKLEIPGSVTSIGDGSFGGCKNLECVTITNNVRVIGDYAFTRCTALTEVEIPGSVASIKGGAFYGCTSLDSIVIPDSVESIEASDGYGAFEECTNLTSVTIGKGVKSIGNYTFYRCANLTTIIYEGTQSQWESITKGSDWDSYTGEYTLTCTDDNSPEA